MHIAIIGAGIAGLLSLHHAIKNNIGQYTVFEQGSEIGGLWVYTDKVGINEFGLPVHGSLYEGLRSNVPIQIMSIPDYPNNITSYNFTSYVNHEDVLKYINEFADHFDLRKYIKFYNHVTKVRPIENNRWEIISLNLQTKEEKSYEFDAVIIANGRRSVPKYPHLKGIETFEGRQLHSHDYRNPKPFQNDQVLVIGAGASGLDITLHLSETADKVFLSNHLKYDISKFYPENVISKPDVDHVDNSSIHFNDDSIDDVNSILYCTGFKMSFPFLTPESGLTFENDYVNPLYKQIINIEYPTMGFMGIPYVTMIFDTLDLQARFYTAYLKNPSKFPTKRRMYMDKERDEEMRKKLGQKVEQFHQLGGLMEIYFNDLSKTAQIKPIPPVKLRIYADRDNRAKIDLRRYKGDLYTIINDTSFYVVRSTIDFY